MTSRWDEFPEASIAALERRATRPGARNELVLEFLNNYYEELLGRRQAAHKRAADEDYLHWVRMQPCVVCGSNVGCDAHHWIGTRSAGTGTKVDDYYTMPLCRRCHRELHQKGHRTWEHTHGITQERAVAKTLRRALVHEAVDRETALAILDYLQRTRKANGG